MRQATIAFIGAAQIPVKVLPQWINRNLPLTSEHVFSSIDLNPSTTLSGVLTSARPIVGIEGRFGKALETIAHCIALKWPVLLVGPSGSGIYTLYTLYTL